MVQTAPRLRIWHYLVGGLGALVLALLIGVPLWLRSTGDIEAFRARAKARGIATSWAELARERPLDPARMEIFQELLQLVDQVQAWEEVYPGQRIVSGEALPESLRDHHQSLGSQFWAQVSQRVLRLEGRPVVMHERISHQTSFPELTVINRLNRLSREAWLLGLIEVEVLLYQADLMEASTMRLFQAQNRNRLNVLTSLTQRSPETLSDHARARLEQWADYERDEFANAVRNEFLTSISSISNMFAGNSESTVLAETSYWQRLRLRWSRGNSLTMLRQMLETAAPGASFDDQWAAVADFGYRASKLHPNRYALANLLIPAVESAHANHTRRTLASRIALYECALGPWPDDPYAVSGTPLRRQERHGVLVGAWSIGPDQIDQHGDLINDRRIELRPPWDPPFDAEPAPRDEDIGSGSRRRGT